MLLLLGATDWSSRWKKNGWKTINGTEVKNKNEFQKLAKLCDEIDVKWVSCLEQRSGNCTVVIALASHQSSLDSISAWCHVWVEFVVLTLLYGFL